MSLPTTSGAARTGARILAVEDSPTELQQLEYTLQEAGFSVFTAGNGRAALDRARAVEPDLVVTDIVMPEMDGFALCEALRADDALHQVPVILLTALMAPEDVLRGLQCGASGFITKPCRDEFLVAQVRRALASQGLREDADRRRAVWYGDRAYVIDADPHLALELLLSTYANAVHQNAELVRTREDLRSLNEELEAKVTARTAALAAEVTVREQLYEELQASMEKIKTLSGIVPICMWCKKIRDDAGYWNQVETFVSAHSDATFTHGLCEECVEKYYPETPGDGAPPAHGTGTRDRPEAPVSLHAEGRA